MRKIFAGAMVFSVIGAVILGGTLAWSNTVILGPNNVSVGQIAFTAVFSPAASALLGPNGHENTVGTIDVSNTGTFNLRVDGASKENPGGSRVVIKNVDQGHASCDTDNFTGSVTPINGDNASPGQVDAPNPPAVSHTVFNLAQVKMSVIALAPNACQGAVVTFDILVVGTTITN